MKTTVDSAGRIVIPRDIRHATGIGPGTVVEVEVREGGVSIEPASAAVKIVKRGRLRIAVTEGGGTLSEDQVRSVRDELRRRR